jgi:hypothetical protein
MILGKYGSSEIGEVIFEKIVSIDMENYFIQSFLLDIYVNCLHSLAGDCNQMVAIITRKLNMKNAA